MDMNMDSSPFILPPPKIKTEDDEPEIIDLDKDKSPEDLVYEWNSRVRMKLKNYYFVESEGALEALMKWYIETFKEAAVNLEDLNNLKTLSIKHIDFFKCYFTQLNCCFIDNYLDNMEEILTVYSNIVVKSIPGKQKHGNKRAYKRSLMSVCHKTICMLNLYLMNREDRVYHVMIKIKITLLSDESKDFLNLLFGKLLTKEPKDKSDLSFCRSYILCQKWKTIQFPDAWEKMDEVMYKLFDQSPESVKNNMTLKEILFPQNNSVLDTLLHISENHIILSQSYFKYMKSMKMQEETEVLPEINEIDLNDHTFSGNLCLDDEERELNRAYISFKKSMSQICKKKDNEKLHGSIMKIEEDDDDCQIVSESLDLPNLEETDLIHELVDDDIEIIYCKKKEHQNTARKGRKDNNTSISFLDSIDISANSDARVDKVSSSTTVDILPFHKPPVISLVSTSTSTDPTERNDSICDTLPQNSTPQKIAPLPTNTTGIVNMEVDIDSISSLTKPDQIPLKPVKTINIETQTEDIAVDVNNLVDCHCNKKDMEDSSASDKSCRSYYHYGLVTPPSDIRSDEHNVPVTDTIPYDNVYTNIVPTHNDHIIDRIDKEVTGVDHQITSVVEENDAVENMEVSKIVLETEKSTDFSPSLDSLAEEEEEEDPHDDQHNVETNEDPNMDYETRFESDLEPVSTEQLQPDNSSELETDKCSSRCDLECEENVDPQEAITDNTDREDQVSENQDVSESLSHDSNLVGESCAADEVSGVLHDVPAIGADADVSKSPTYRLCITPPSHNDIPPIRSPSPKNYIENSSVPLSIPCTSTDSVAAPSSNNDISTNVQCESVSVPCLSPDITSTSNDIQDLDKNKSGGEEEPEDQAGYEHVNVVIENEEYLSNGDYCTEEYLIYAESDGDNGELVNNENVSQSNLQDGEPDEQIQIEDPILMDNEELSYIIGEALPIGANVNICMDTEFDESSIHSDVTSAVRNLEGVQPEVVDQIEKVDVTPPKVVADQIVEKVDVTPPKDVNVTETVNNKTDIAANCKKIMYTSSKKVRHHTAEEFSKFEENIQLRWNQLKEMHNLDEIFSGPILKMNGASSVISPDTSFDLFNSKPPETPQESTPPTSSSSNSSLHIASPAFEGIDDFRSYYDENKNNNMLGISSPTKMPPVPADKPANDLVEKIPTKTVAPKIIHHNKVNSLKTTALGSGIKPRGHKISEARPRTNGKRIRISETPTTDTTPSVPHSTTTTDNPPVLQSILKKKSSYDSVIVRPNAKRGTKFHIPRRLMNLKSLSEYKVKPNDPCIQSYPCVVIEKLSESEIGQWLTVSEISRKIRLEKQQAQFASSQLIFRVDYDKQTSHINENDVVRYNTPNGKRWRSNSKQTKSSRLDEGLSLKVLPYTEKKNGKRKRQNSPSYDSGNFKKRRDFRKGQERILEKSSKRKPSGRRRKTEKDY